MAHRVVDVNRGEDGRRHSLNPSERLRQCSTIASIQVDVVARRVCDSEAHRVSNHERHGFGFELARVTRAGTILSVVKQFVSVCASSHKRTHVVRLVMSVQWDTIALLRSRPICSTVHG